MLWSTLIRSEAFIACVASAMHHRVVYLSFTRMLFLGLLSTALDLCPLPAAASSMRLLLVNPSGFKSC